MQLVELRALTLDDGHDSRFFVLAELDLIRGGDGVLKARGGGERLGATRERRGGAVDAGAQRLEVVQELDFLGGHRRDGAAVGVGVILQLRLVERAEDFDQPMLLLHVLIFDVPHALFQLGVRPLQDLSHRRRRGLDVLLLRLDLRLRLRLSLDQSLESVVLNGPQTIGVVLATYGVQELAPLPFAHVLRLHAHARIFDDVVKVRSESVVRMVRVVRVDDLLHLTRGIERRRMLLHLLLHLRE